MLISIEHHVLDIPKRVREEVDPFLVVYFNTSTQKFEVHDMAAVDTYVLSVDDLDSRVIPQLKRAKFSHRTPKQLLRELEEADYRREQQRIRDMKNLQEAMREDLKWAGRELYRMGV